MCKWFNIYNLIQETMFRYDLSIAHFFYHDRMIDDIIFQNQGELILEECDKMSMFVQSYIRDLL